MDIENITHDVAIVLDTKRPRECVECGNRLRPGFNEVFLIQRFKTDSGRRRELAPKYLCKLCGDRHVRIPTLCIDCFSSTDIEPPMPAKSLFRRVFGLFGL